MASLYTHTIVDDGGNMIVENDDDDDGTTVSFRGGEVLINGEPEGEQDIIERHIIERLTAFLTDTPLSIGDYDEWARDAIGVYRDLLDDMGLGEIAVLGGQPNGDYVDNIEIRDPLGVHCLVPDPTDEYDADDPHDVDECCRPVIDFFLALYRLKRDPAAQRTITVTTIRSLTEKGEDHG